MAVVLVQVVTSLVDALSAARAEMQYMQVTPNPGDIYWTMSATNLQLVTRSLLAF